MLDQLGPAQQRAPGEEWRTASGLGLELHSRGFDYPVRIVFHPHPERGAPLYYVSELPGRIRAVESDGKISTLVDGLLNFEWREMAEIGLMGMAIDPKGESLYLTLAYWDDGAGVYRNRVERLDLSEDGRQVRGRTALLDMRDEPTVVSYCVQFASIGPDGALYVGVGKGNDPNAPQDLGRFAGKILRMSKEGKALPDNPFYDPAAPSAPRSYVYALGLRNPFDLAWDPASGAAIASDVGPGLDRVLRMERGRNYCFGGAFGDEGMRCNALYTWGPGGSYAPTGLALLPDGADGAARLYVGIFGAVHIPGGSTGKRMERFHLDASGALTSGSETAVRYTGPYYSSVSDVEAHDGTVYFADVYGPGELPHRERGLVYRLVPGRGEAVSDQVTGSPLERGVALFASLGCAACHARTPADGTKEGPALDAGLGARLETQLGGDAYERTLSALEAREGEYFVARRPLYRELRALKGAARVRAWFKAHLRDPRFDHPEGKMPGFPGLSAEDLDALAAYLLGEN
jgi:mono/diheme cytochrome c family protein